ncbi:unnamed protein product [Adineta ricciae]|uniref:Uncharacterized protein n=1 Tax=Adineta ricciae TaxID=249248 RepID=A0A815KDY8_ADIRI|nr:unnamed protein product [Adineta ricciae]CAF1394840.1 unnamed protein product [Adineta ricciae]
MQKLERSSELRPISSYLMFANVRPDTKPTKASTPIKVKPILSCTLIEHCATKERKVTTGTVRSINTTTHSYSAANKRQKFPLISDCWGGPTHGKGLHDHLSGCTRVEIPKKMTDQIQPLDVFFKRQMKVIPRRSYDRVLLDQVNINSSEREDIVRLMSLTHN